MNEEQKKVNAEAIKRYRGTRTQKQYSEDLFVTIRTIQNWESRGCSMTTLALLQTIYLQEKEIKRLKKQLKDNNMTFKLPK